MAHQQEIADYVRRRITLGRVQPGLAYWPAGVVYRLPYRGPALAPPEQLAVELLHDADFRALQLGQLLNTPTGAFLEEAVALAVPRSLSPEFDLIVTALKLAADLQQRKQRGNLVLIAGGTLLAGLFIREIGNAA